MSEFKKVMATLKIEVGEHVFTAVLPAEVTPFTDSPAFAPEVTAPFYEFIARWLATHGAKSPETFRYLRTRAGLSQAQLGELLGVDKSQVSNWESGRFRFDVGTWYAVASLALDALDGRHDTADRLRATQVEQPKEVEYQSAG